MSLFIQVYGGCGLATLIGFLALCHSSATRLRRSSLSTQVTGKQPLTY